MTASLLMGVHSYWQIHSQAFMSAHNNIWMCYKPFIKLHLELIEAKQTGQDTIVCLSCLNIPSSLYLFAWFPVIVVRSLLYLCVWGVYEFTTHTVSSCTEISFFSFFFFFIGSIIPHQFPALTVWPRVSARDTVTFQTFIFPHQARVTVWK